MASFLNKTQLFSHLRSNPQKSESLFAQTRRGYHIDLGEREKALLAKDPALSKFKSHKQGVKLIKKIGDVLTVILVAGSLNHCYFGWRHAGFCYEIYVKTTMRKAAEKQA